MWRLGKQNDGLAPMAIEKNKILGAVLELPAKLHWQYSPFGPFFAVNRLVWQCCFAGTSKTAPMILIFLIAMGADYSFCVKLIATRAPTFFGYIILVLASVYRVLIKCASKYTMPKICALFLQTNYLQNL